MRNIQKHFRRGNASLTLITAAQADGTTARRSVDPQARLADVLARIADTPQSRLSDLLPWNRRRTTVKEKAA